MAIEHILSVYPRPKKPCIYTGLFSKRLSKRPWSNEPNKCSHGVSYTQYEDAMKISFGSMSLFDYFHGSCWYYAKYFQHKNPEWKTISLLRGNWRDSIVHTFCIKQLGDKTLFADARGITDDPVEFFSDFSFSKNSHIVEDTDEMELSWFGKDYKKAYDFIFKDNMPSELLS